MLGTHACAEVWAHAFNHVPPLGTSRVHVGADNAAGLDGHSAHLDRGVSKRRLPCANRGGVVWGRDRLEDQLEVLWLVQLWKGLREHCSGLHLYCRPVLQVVREGTCVAVDSQEGGFRGAGRLQVWFLCVAAAAALGEMREDRIMPTLTLCVGGVRRLK